MDKIWDRNQSRRVLAVVAGMKKPNDHAEQKSNAKKKEAYCITRVKWKTVLA